MSIAKQGLLFDMNSSKDSQKYNSKIEAPVYEPRHARPHLMQLWDETKPRNLIREIDAANIQEEEKEFLRAAAYRHAVFHYENIADYYAHATPEVQELMERSALIIIDFESAIEQGFVRLCDEIHRQYLEEYNGND